MSTQSLELIIAQIRKEEKEKLLQEFSAIKENRISWDKVSDYINDWGEKYGNYPWHVSKIKNAIYLIIRESLQIDRMAHLTTEQLPLAIEICDTILDLIEPRFTKKTS